MNRHDFEFEEFIVAVAVSLPLLSFFVESRFLGSLSGDTDSAESPKASRIFYMN
jgi:hypothetical protein